MKVTIICLNIVRASSLSRSTSMLSLQVAIPVRMEFESERFQVVYGFACRFSHHWRLLLGVIGRPYLYVLYPVFASLGAGALETI